MGARSLVIVFRFRDRTGAEWQKTGSGQAGAAMQVIGILTTVDTLAIIVLCDCIPEAVAVGSKAYFSHFFHSKQIIKFYGTCR